MLTFERFFTSKGVVYQIRLLVNLNGSCAAFVYLIEYVVYMW